MKRVIALAACLFLCSQCAESKEHPRWRAFGRGLGRALQGACAAGAVASESVMNTAAYASANQIQLPATSPVRDMGVHAYSTSTMGDTVYVQQLY